MSNRSSESGKYAVAVLVLFIATVAGRYLQATPADQVTNHSRRDFQLLAQNSTEPAEPKLTSVRMRSYLTHRIVKTHALLVEQAPLIQDDLDWLKAAGHMDRRAKISIERNIAKAVDTMNELYAMQAAEVLDLSRTKAITYDLGMEGDAFARWASELGDSGSEQEQGADSAEGWAISRRLEETSQRLKRLSDMLWDTANAVVRNLGER